MGFNTEYHITMARETVPVMNPFNVGFWHKAEAPEARYHVRFLRYCGHSLAYGYGAKLPTALLQAQFPDGAKFLISAPSGEFWPVSPCSLFDSIILATSSEIVAQDHAR